MAPHISIIVKTVEFAILLYVQHVAVTRDIIAVSEVKSLARKGLVQHIWSWFSLKRRSGLNTIGRSFTPKVNQPRVPPLVRSQRSSRTRRDYHQLSFLLLCREASLRGQRGIKLTCLATV